MKIILDIAKVFQELLLQEDIDQDKRITVEDKGPKKFHLTSDGQEIIVEGTYFLSNLLQELILAGEQGNDCIDTDRIFEKPAERISRMIREYFWEGLTRTMDEKEL